MRLITGLLERFGWRRAKPRQRRDLVAPLRHSSPSPAPLRAPVEPVRPVEPLEDAVALQRERELKELRHSFRAGILDVRFRELDLDPRFVEEFAKFLGSGDAAFSAPPAAAFDVMRIVDDPGCPVKKVAAAIMCDPSLAGAVLSLANSPLHRGVREIESRPDAIVRLGQHSLRLLLLEIALHSTRVQFKPYETFSTLVWKHSLLCAQLARLVAKPAGVDADHAYMAGLFHDIGHFVVLSAARKLANRMDRRISAQTLLRLVETHAHSLDGRVIAAWRLPAPVVQAVIHRTRPNEAKEHAPLAAVVALANDLGRPLGAWIPQAAIDFARHPALELLKLAPEQLPDEATLLEIAQKIEKVAGMR